MRGHFSLWNHRNGLVQTAQGRLLLLFALEGCCLQFISSVNGLGNTIYATNLGATDTQIGLVQMMSNIMAVALLLPVGMWGNRSKTPGRVPYIMLLFVSAMYLCYGSVPALAKQNPMPLYFVFLSLTAGIIVTFGAPWQAFFAGCTTQEQRNDVFTFRNKFMFFVGFAAPLVFGALLSAAPDQTHKLLVLRCFYYANAALAFVQALLIRRLDIDFGALKETETVHKRESMPKVLLGALQDRRFVSFLVFIVIFYMSWHFDWSIWYIAQTRYCGMNEAHLSYCNAFASLAQLACIGCWGRLNRRRGVFYTFHLGIIGLLAGGAAMFAALFCPPGVSPWVVIVFNTAANGLSACVGLCVLQMLLSQMPKGNEALLISFYTLLTMISNSLMPLVGVKVYEALGADLHAIRLTFGCMLLWRVAVLLWHNCRYRAQQKQAQGIRVNRD
jgi:Na+/melibiose symporter-like transporter